MTIVNWEIPRPAPPAQRPPQRLPDPLPRVQPFAPTLLPDALRGWCVDAAEGLGVPLDFLAVPAIVAAAAAIGRAVAVRAKVQDRWIERAILWGAVIGRPSSGKSPALAPARRMLARLESEAAKAHAAAVADAMAEQNLHVANAELAKSEMRAAVKAKDTAAAARLAREASAPRLKSSPSHALWWPMPPWRSWASY